jgi:hypothetical protein
LQRNKKIIDIPLPQKWSLPFSPFFLFLFSRCKEGGRVYRFKIAIVVVPDVSVELAWGVGVGGEVGGVEERVRLQPLLVPEDEVGALVDICVEHERIGRRGVETLFGCQKIK